ncbi:MAG: flagellar basal body P-ring protein FlgI [Synergistaceae bacterium]|nr:flagellar basal body P-ring protein FlgI [Synergistaceae bacterium]
MKKIFLILIFVFVSCKISFAAVNLQDMDYSRVNSRVRIKDITEVEGARNNQLTGIGLVTGLDGTGDNSQMAVQMMRNMMRNFGVTLDARSVRTRNIAVVALTANLPPYVRPGQNIDVNVNTMGNASSLQGGVLLQSPLRAADGKVYAVAQGPVITGLNTAQETADLRARNMRPQNIMTAGRIPKGAIVEREVPSDYTMGGQVALLLRDPDFTTAQRVTDAINRAYGVVAYAVDAGRVEINLPGQYVQAPAAFLANMGGIEIEPDTTAKVAINERSGTVVMGGNVRISSVGVAHGMLTVEVGEDANVMPETAGEDNFVRARRNDITEDEADGSMLAMPATTTVRDLVRVMNSLGATPRDIIEILQAIDKAGALHGELVIM